jgi:hypothetical protein
MKRGILPLVPVEFFGPANQDSINLWKTFFLAKPDERAVWISALKPEERDLPCWPACLLGLVREKALEELWYPEPPVLQQMKKPLEILKQEGVKIIPFKYPPMRNIDFLRNSICKAISHIGMTQDELESRVDAWATLRATVKRLDGIQTRSLALSSRQYIEALHSVPDPSMSLPALNKETELKVALHYKGLGQDHHIRIGILGIPPFENSFYEVLDDAGALVVYEELGLEGFPLGHFSDLALLYNQLSLPYGIKVRRDKLEKEKTERSVDAFIYCTHSLAESRSNVVFLESELGTPFYIFEIKNGPEPSLLECKLLRRFFDEFLEKKGKGSRKK